MTTKLSNERMAELSAALRAKGRLRWGEGSRIIDGRRQNGRVFDGDDTYAVWFGEGPTTDGGGYQEQGPVGPELFLDLNDPATVGVLADYARELWGKKDLHLLPYCSNDGAHNTTWWSSEWPTILDGHGTRAEAWVAAILSAPERGGS